MYVIALHIAHGLLRSFDQWPGYGDDWEKQVRLEGDTRDRSVNRLAGIVANKVRDFIYVSSSISAPIVALKKAPGARLKCQQIRWHMRKMEDR